MSNIQRSMVQMEVDVDRGVIYLHDVNRNISVLRLKLVLPKDYNIKNSMIDGSVDDKVTNISANLFVR